MASFPCTAAPERWLDPSDRTHALATCLQCPARRWCAREALHVRASWGMWAGVWIGGRLTEVADRLHAIAEEPTAGRPSVVLPAPRAPSPPEMLAPLPRVRRPPRSTAAPALVLARSAGQCEILGEACRLTADVQCSRVAGLSARHARSPAAVYAACRSCAAAVRTACAADARALGYLVDSPSHAASVPFRWRGARWVLLDRYGQLLEIHFDARDARAS